MGSKAKAKPKQGSKGKAVSKPVSKPKPTPVKPYGPILKPDPRWKATVGKKSNRGEFKVGQRVQLTCPVCKRAKKPSVFVWVCRRGGRPKGCKIHPHGRKEA